MLPFLTFPQKENKAHKLRQRTRKQNKGQIKDKSEFQIKRKLSNGFTKPFESSVDGDPYGNRTHDYAVKGRRLNLLTNGPNEAADISTASNGSGSEI